MHKKTRGTVPSTEKKIAISFRQWVELTRRDRRGEQGQSSEPHKSVGGRQNEWKDTGQGGKGSEGHFPSLWTHLYEGDRICGIAYPYTTDGEQL